MNNNIKDMTELHYFNVLYVCNETCLCIHYQDRCTLETYEEDNTSYDEVLQRVFSDIKNENLSTIDGKLTLKGVSDGFDTSHVIENQDETDYSLLYVDEIDEFIKEMSGFNNIGIYNDELGSSYQFVEGVNLNKIENVMDQYTSLESYDDIKKIIIQDKTFKFFPYCIWTKKKRIEKSKIKTSKVVHKFTIQANNKIKANK